MVSDFRHSGILAALDGNSLDGIGQEGLEFVLESNDAD